jgi:hypothetical protein
LFRSAIQKKEGKKIFQRKTKRERERERKMRRRHRRPVLRHYGDSSAAVAAAAASACFFVFVFVVIAATAQSFLLVGASFSHVPRPPPQKKTTTMTMIRRAAIIPEGVQRGGDRLFLLLPLPLPTTTTTTKTALEGIGRRRREGTRGTARSALHGAKTTDAVATVTARNATAVAKMEEEEEEAVEPEPAAAPGRRKTGGESRNPTTTKTATAVDWDNSKQELLELLALVRREKKRSEKQEECEASMAEDNARFERIAQLVNQLESLYYASSTRALTLPFYCWATQGKWEHAFCTRQSSRRRSDCSSSSTSTSNSSAVTGAGAAEQQATAAPAGSASTLPQYTTAQPRRTSRRLQIVGASQDVSSSSYSTINEGATGGDQGTSSGLRRRGTKLRNTVAWRYFEEGNDSDGREGAVAVTTTKVCSGTFTVICETVIEEPVELAGSAFSHIYGDPTPTTATTERHQQIGGAASANPPSSPPAPPPRWRQLFTGVAGRELELDPGTAFVPDGPSVAWLVRALRRRSPSPALLDPDLLLPPPTADYDDEKDGDTNDNKSGGGGGGGAAAPYCCLAADTTYLDADIRIFRYTTTAPAASSAAATTIAAPAGPQQQQAPNSQALSTTVSASWEGVRDIFVRNGVL